MEVGIRELKNSLSRYVRQVRAGGEIVVTDHGQPVARLVPFEGRSAVERMIAEGRITEGQPKLPTREMPDPVKVPGLKPEDLAREIEAGRGP